MEDSLTTEELLKQSSLIIEEIQKLLIELSESELLVNGKLNFQRSDLEEFSAEMQKLNR